MDKIKKKEIMKTTPPHLRLLTIAIVQDIKAGGPIFQAIIKRLSQEAAKFGKNIFQNLI